MSLKRTNKAKITGKKQKTGKMTDMLKFQREKRQDPNAPVTIRKISIEEMNKKYINEHNEGIGLY